MVTVLMCASVFQRRSRTGFLDELETVRGEALTAPRGEVATAVALADAAEAQDRLNGEGDDGLEWTGWPGDDDMVDDADQIWTEPSPHPIRPQEMWHAAGGQARRSGLGEQPDPAGDDAPVTATVDEAAETAEATGTDVATGAEVTRSDDLDHDRSAASSDGPRRRFARFRPVDQPGETSPMIDGPEVPVIPTADGNGLLGGPVRRRTRAGRDRRPLPDGRPLRAATSEPEEHSPLVEAPLPPAAPAVLAPIEAEPVHLAPVAEARLVLDDRSELAVGATVVRFGDGSRTSMDHGEQGPVVLVHEGWCWVTALGAGPCVAVRAQLPQAEITVDAGGRMLALVEPDGSAFVVVFTGSASLAADGDRTSLEAGTMVLLTADGARQVDQAEADELAADPLVAHNLELDATR